MKKTTATMKKTTIGSREGEASPSRLIDARIAALSDWRGETLARVRKLMHEADPEMVEECPDGPLLPFSLGFTHRVSRKSS